jgi:hypothetical protein
MVETGANPDLHRFGPTRSVALGLAGTAAPNPVMVAQTALASTLQVPELLDMSFEDLLEVEIRSAGKCQEQIREIPGQRDHPEPREDRALRLRSTAVPWGAC